MPMEFVQASGALMLWKIPIGAVVLDPKGSQKQPGGATKMGFFQEYGPLGLVCCSSARMSKISSTQSNVKQGKSPRNEQKCRSIVKYKCDKIFIFLDVKARGSDCAA